MTRVLSPAEKLRAEEGTRLPMPQPGWRTELTSGGFFVLVRDYPGGLRALFSIDPYASWSDAEDAWWRHLSVSRIDRYPKWDEMRNLVYSCGYFDATRSVSMVLPSKDEYVGTLGTGPKRFGTGFGENPNVFHWWQRE